MKLLIVGGISADGTEDAQKYRDYFLEASKDADLEVFAIGFDDLFFDVSQSAIKVIDTVNDVEVSSYSRIILRGKVRASADIAYALSMACRYMGVEVCNSYELYRQPSKLSQALTMHELGLPFPRTLFQKNTHKFAEKITAKLSFPFIMKDSYGSHGLNNYLVKDETSLREIVASQPDVKFVAQEFISNNGDYRILIMKTRHLLIFRRAIGDSHLNNTTQGASAELHKDIDVPKEIIEQAHSLASHLRMDIAGVDVLKTTDDKYFFLEINSQPQITDGAFVTEKQAMLGEMLAEISGHSSESNPSSS